MMDPSTHSPKFHRTLWSWVFRLAALEGVAAVITLALLPADAGGRFFGFSAARLLLMGLILGLAFACALVAWQVQKSGRVAGWFDPQRRRWIWNLLFVLLPLGALACALIPVILLSLYHTGGDFRYFAYYERLLPLFLWLLLACLEMFVGLALSGGYSWRAWPAAPLEQRRVFRVGLAAWGLFGLVVLFVALTGIGVTPDRVGWGLPTVSLLEWQVWAGWAAGSAFLLFAAYRGWNPRRDWLLAGAIWLLAVGLWLSQPIRPAYFATAGRAPNFEIYPFSDGAYYDHFAQSVLIGNGFKGNEIPARPFYITLLAGFHLLAGQKYGNVIFVQTLLLAFFPVVLFFLGRELHSRPAGLGMALLAILREVTAIITTPITDNASNSKLLFADLPTALVISLWVLLAVLWLKAPGRRPLMPLLVGGFMGLAMLFRTQSLFMLPGVLLLALLVYRGQWERWLRAVLLIGLGLALTVAPYLWRNWTVTGRLVFDDDRSQTGVVAQRYSLDGIGADYAYRPGEDPKNYSARVTQAIFSFLRAHPGVVAGFVSGHFLNAEIANGLVLPVRYGISDLRELVMPTTPFWQDWKGALTAGQAVVFLANLGLIALGIGACFVRLGWVGLVLLVVNLSYNLSNALARNSGGRYLLVVDWVGYAYAAIGLMEISLAVLSMLGVDPQRLAQGLACRVRPDWANSPDWHWPGKRIWRAGLGIGMAFLLVGALPPLSEWLVPARYPQQTQAQLLAEALQDPALQESGVDRAALEQFAAQPGVMIVKGRALYPRYYKAGDGEPRTAKTGYEPLNYARTLFIVTGNTYNGLVILKSAEVPAPLPNAADVMIIACPGSNYLDARLTLVQGRPGGAHLADAGLAAPCPAKEGSLK